MQKWKTAVIAGLVGFACNNLHSTEYFVSPAGRDDDSGRRRTNAFATIQQGVDALEPGDRLTILPGEYHEHVRRDGLGSRYALTTIRAAIPGTVVLRGDVPAPAFEKVDGYRFVYAADFAFDGDIPAVNELDTLTILPSKPNPTELEYAPGTFHFDAAAQRLYISTTDMRAPDAHAYSVSLIPTHGFYLRNATRVLIEGLGATGFNGLNLLHYRERTMGAVFGIFIAYGKHCTVRHCNAWLNGAGIGLNSMERTNGDNLIEVCAAWGNNSAFMGGDIGGISGFAVRRDVFRDCVAYRNGHYGINIYGTGIDRGGYGDPNVPGNDSANRSRFIRSLTWGNGTDVKIKTGIHYFHTVEQCIWTGQWSIKTDPIHCLIGEIRDHQSVPEDNIVLQREEALDPDKEFADPANFDYRLQATSRFRDATADNLDRGPFPYEPDVFFVKPDGDDGADGLSIANAWDTLARAVKDLKGGDTLYLLQGTYEGELDLAMENGGAAPISIRGRGTEPAVLQGPLQVSGTAPVEFQRLTFKQPVVLRGAPGAGGPPPRGGPTSRHGTSGVARGTTGAASVAFRHCLFSATNTSLRATGIDGLVVDHCAFSNFTHAALDLTGCTGVDLRGNWFDNTRGAAVRVNTADAIRYAGYNGYRTPDGAWEPAMDNLPPTPHLLPPLSATAGPFGKPLGPYRDAPVTPELKLTLEPEVHSLSATTANIEWGTSLPAGCLIAWGKTPACENTAWYDVNIFGTYSLTGLEPGTTYYFTIQALREPSSFRQVIGIHEEPAILAQRTDAPIAFTTPATDPAPRVYHVAPDGDNDNDGLTRGSAWRTIHHAASKVRVGDTVRIAGGEYSETVRIRATGAANAPITFQCAPGGKVVLSGAGERLSHGFIVGGKQHLRFDGFRFRDYNMEVVSHYDTPYGWAPLAASEFNVYRCRDIQIRRCLSDGRGGYSAGFLTAFEVENLTVDNCVFVNKMGCFDLYRSPNAIVRNNVWAIPMIASFMLNNAPGQDAFFEKNIFCGMMLKKAAMQAPYAEVEEISTLHIKDNCFLLRAFPPDERYVFMDVDHALRKVTAKYTIPAFESEFGDKGTVLADPEFAGVKALLEEGRKPREYPPEMLLQQDVQFDFDSFFATNPELVDRGIGLQPEAFEEVDNVP